MPKMHLQQPGFTYSACSWFTKSKEKIEKFMQTENIDYINKNDFDKAMIRAGYKKNGFLMPPYPLTNFDIQK